MQGRARLQTVGAGHGEERTANMLYMLVTLEVSKLSGWLNADACCRVGRRAYDAGRGAGRAAGGQCSCGGASSVQEEGAQGKRRSERKTCRTWI